MKDKLRTFWTIPPGENVKIKILDNPVGKNGEVLYYDFEASYGNTGVKWVRVCTNENCPDRSNCKVSNIMKPIHNIFSNGVPIVAGDTFFPDTEFRYKLYYKTGGIQMFRDFDLLTAEFMPPFKKHMYVKRYFQSPQTEHIDKNTYNTFRTTIQELADAFQDEGLYRHGIEII